MYLCFKKNYFADANELELCADGWRKETRDNFSRPDKIGGGPDPRQQQLKWEREIDSRGLKEVETAGVIGFEK